MCIRDLHLVTWLGAQTHTDIYIYIHLFIYLFLFICLFVYLSIHLFHIPLSLSVSLSPSLSLSWISLRMYLHLRIIGFLWIPHIFPCVSSRCLQVSHSAQRLHGPQQWWRLPNALALLVRGSPQPAALGFAMKRNHFVQKKDGAGSSYKFSKCCIGIIGIV